MGRKPVQFDGDITELERRGIAVSLLEFMMSQYDELREMSLLEVYHLLGDVLGNELDGLNLSATRKGKFRDFAESVVYKSFADTLNLTEDTRAVRTVHKAKSEEFDNVLVYFGDEKRCEKQLRHIFDPQDTEEKRIVYVACSRARERLFVAVPRISDEDKALLQSQGIEVISVHAEALTQ